MFGLGVGAFGLGEGAALGSLPSHLQLLVELACERDDVQLVEEAQAAVADTEREPEDRRPPAPELRQDRHMGAPAGDEPIPSPSDIAVQAASEGAIGVSAGSGTLGVIMRPVLPRAVARVKRLGLGLESSARSPQHAHSPG